MGDAVRVCFANCSLLSPADAAWLSVPKAAFPSPLSQAAPGRAEVSIASPGRCLRAAGEKL